jgi:glycosyltransferase involved in cell wall biosynthesis
VISEFTKSRLWAIGRVDPGKVKVIPNCVSSEFVAMPKPWPASTQGHGQLTQGKVRVLLVGTTDNKNLTRVVEACSGLGVLLCILGRPTEAQRTQLAALGVQHEIHHGLSTQEVVALYQSCDLVCFVSTYEGFGMPILEAQAIGRPVLTSDLSPMREVAGEGALKVDPLVVSAIRDGLRRILNDNNLRSALIGLGFENVKKFSAETVAMQYAEIYREVLGK